MPTSPDVICLGAGPAGLTAADYLTKHGTATTVVEADPSLLGGISRTVVYRGFRLDIGGHRFFTKSARVNAIWHELLGDDFVQRARKSRIFYRGKFFAYPLQAMNALFTLGVVESARCVLSYVWARLFPAKNPRNFEEFMCNRFGRRLYTIFFRSYTEKVWGMKCTEISADWAKQRIKGFSLSSAIIGALIGARKGQGKVHATTIDSFHYPRQGCGMMWEKMGERVEAQGGKILRGQKVVELRRTSERWQVVVRNVKGQRKTHEAKHVISSLPIQELVEIITAPCLPEEARATARELRYRDFLVVALIVSDRQVFDDNWVYIHEPSVRVGRIQNFKAWSAEMIPDESKACYGMEYFCFAGDELWEMPDEELIALAKQELVSLGLAKTEDIDDGVVVRQPKAYPVYDDGYQARLALIREAFAQHCPNLHLVGRNGMHRYNNQDHSMLSALLTAENIVAGKKIHDVWQLDDTYIEEDASSARLTPTPVSNRHPSSA